MLISCGSSSLRTALEVVATSPSDGAIDQPRKVSVGAAFSLPMDGNTLNESTFFIEGPQGRARGRIHYDSVASTITWEPVDRLDLDTTYAAVLTEDCRSSDGQQLARRHSWTFTIRPRTWTRPFRLGAGQILGLASDTSGNLHCVWGGNSAPAFHLSLDVLGRSSPATQLPIPRVERAALAVDASGKLTAAVISTSGELSVTELGADGKWVMPQIIATAATASPSVAVSDRGHVLVGWQSGDFGFARAYAPTSNWGEARALGATVPRVFLNSEGEGYVVYVSMFTRLVRWVYRSTTHRNRECVDRFGNWTLCDRSVGVGFRSPIHGTTATFDPSGNALLVASFVYPSLTESLDLMHGYRFERGIWHADLPSDGRNTLGGGGPFDPALARGTNGTSVLAWNTGSAVRLLQLIAIVRDPTSKQWSEPFALNSARAQSHVAAVSSNGLVVVAWDDGGLHVREHDSSAGWRPTLSLTSHADALESLCAASAGERTSIAWSRSGEVWIAHHD